MYTEHVKSVLLVPIFNESQLLPDLLVRLDSSMHVVFVDDCSDDASPPILLHYLASHEYASILRLKRNCGKSFALKMALQYLWVPQSARELPFLTVYGSVPRLDEDDLVVFIDGDNQHDPRLARPLVEELQRRRLDMLTACRNLQGYKVVKRLGNRLLSWQASWLSGQHWCDSQCGMRALKASLVPLVLEVLSGQGFCFEQELSVALPLLGCSTANDFLLPPGHARSNSTWRDAWQIFIAAWKVWGKYAPLGKKLRGISRYFIDMRINKK